MSKKRVTIIFLLTITAFVLYLCYVIFSPFLRPLLSAVVLAVVFYPFHARMQNLVRQPSLAALCSTLLVTLIIIVPAVVIGAAVVREARELYEIVGEKTAEQGGWLPFISNLIEGPKQWLGRYVDLSNFDLRAEIASRAQQLSAALLAEARALAGGLTSFIVNTVITLFTLFFFFREGRGMRRRMGAVLPLSQEQYERLVTGISGTITATVYGGLVVAVIQGLLTGLALWAFGIRSAVLWGVVATVFALIPFVGSGAVWLPAAVYLILSGSWGKGVALIALGALLIGSVDNLLRPYLMSGQVHMHTLLIFFAVLGGLQVFGFLGLFVGPVILAFAITLLGMLREEGRTWMASLRDEPAPEAAPAGPPAEFE